MAKTFPMAVGRLPCYSGLDGENADNYYRAAQRMALLSSEVINPFRDSLRGCAGYSDTNIPEKEVEVRRALGRFSFAVKVTPTKKRPGYKDIFDELSKYLASRSADYRKRNRPAGILTLDGEPYISASEVLGMIRKAKNRVASEGVKTEINTPELPATPDSVTVSLGTDMGRLTEGNAALYLGSLALYEEFGGLTDAFEEELLGLTGFDSSHPPDETEHLCTQVGGHIFHVASVPYQSTSYGKVLSGLDGEPAKKDIEKGGDLVLATAGVELPRLKLYDAKRRDGGVFVRLNGLLKRMDALVAENTETRVRQPVCHYPVV